MACATCVPNSPPTTTCVCERTAQQAALSTPPLETPFPVPDYPPADWFEGPPSWVPEWRAEHGLEIGVDDRSGEDRSLRLTVTDDGRVGGWFYQQGVCLVDGQAGCWEPPPSATGYALFHQQDVVTDDGKLIKVGVIGNVGGHASPFVGPSTAQRHYADPDSQLIICRAGDDATGGWIAGSMVPGLSWSDVALVRRSALSGDWRPMDRKWFRFAGVRPTDPQGYDCVGPTLVNRPGLPLIRQFARTASMPVYLGGLGGVQLDQEVTMIRLPNGTTIDDASLDLLAAALAARTAAPGDVPIDRKSVV